MSLPQKCLLTFNTDAIKYQGSLSLPEKLKHDQLGTDKHHLRLWALRSKNKASMILTKDYNSRAATHYKGWHHDSLQETSESVEETSALLNFN